MKASDVCVGDHCLFKFSGASVTPVTVVALCEKDTDCFWIFSCAAHRRVIQNRESTRKDCGYHGE